MKLRLDSARDEPLRWQESIVVDAGGLGLDPEVALSPVAVDGTLSRIDPGYRLVARLDYRQTVPCDRCLAPVVAEVSVPVDLVVVEAGPRRELAGGEHELREAELGVVEVDDGVLVTESLVAEQVQIHLPTHPLCREDCAGLCPRCGADRNRVACGCATDETDPRWAALAAFKAKDGGH
jgi:uncharacterized protein